MSGDKLYILGSKAEIITPEEIARVKQIPFRSFLSIEKLCNEVEEARCVLAYTPYRLHNSEGQFTKTLLNWREISARLTFLKFNGSVIFIDNAIVSPCHEGKYHLLSSQTEISELMNIVEESYAS